MASKLAHVPELWHILRSPQRTRRAFPRFSKLPERSPSTTNPYVLYKIHICSTESVTGLDQLCPATFQGKNGWESKLARIMGVPEIRRHIIIETTPERVYEAWTEPDHLARWFCDKVVGWPGYGGTLTMTWKKFGFSMDYYLQEITPPKKIIMKSPIPGLGMQTLNITIRPYGKGCHIEIVETGPGAEGQEGAGDAKSGWEMSLALLKTYLEYFWNKNRRMLFSIITAPYEEKRLMHYYKDDSGLSKWFTKSGSIGDPGSDVNLVLKNDMILTGKVMAVTSHELLITWKEVNGFLELKSFTGTAERRAVLIRGSVYGDLMDDEEIEELNQFIEQSVGTLHIILKAEEEARQTIAARRAAEEERRQAQVKAEAEAAAVAAAAEILASTDRETIVQEIYKEEEEKDRAREQAKQARKAALEESRRQAALEAKREIEAAAEAEAKARASRTINLTASSEAVGKSSAEGEPPKGNK